MKKLVLVVLAFLFCMAAFAQGITVNVHVRNGNQRLYFTNSHSWMKSHGYYYNNNGYYTGRNRRIYPSRREYYHANTNKWSNSRVYSNGKSKYNNGRGNGRKKGKK